MKREEDDAVLLSWVCRLERGNCSLGGSLVVVFVTRIVFFVFLGIRLCLFCCLLPSSFCPRRFRHSFFSYPILFLSAPPACSRHSSLLLLLCVFLSAPPPRLSSACQTAIRHPPESFSWRPTESLEKLSSPWQSENRKNRNFTPPAAHSRGRVRRPLVSQLGPFFLRLLLNLTLTRGLSIREAVQRVLERRVVIAFSSFSEVGIEEIRDFERGGGGRNRS